jgi:spermidine/putrescine transport system permease protein
LRVTDFFRSYGRGLGVLIIALTAVWLILLIVVPQLAMVKRAFTVETRGGASAMLSIEIDRAYQSITVAERELARLRAPQEPGNASAVPRAASPQLGVPSAAAVPSAAGVPPSASGSQAAPLGEAQRLARQEELEASIRTQRAEIERLEALEERKGETADSHVGLGNFTSMSRLHLWIFMATLGYSLLVTIIALVLCYPVAYAVASARTAERAALLLGLLTIPYAINELLRIFAWVMVLEKQGLLNQLLGLLGFVDLAAGEGIRWVASNNAVFAVMVYAYVLFMVFPIYNTLETLDRNQIEAARDLGASIWRTHWRVIIPHAKPGIAVGAIMTFMLAAGSIAVPEIIGRGLHPDWFSQVIYRRFFEGSNWNEGSAYALALLAACMVFVLGMMALFRVGIRDIAR